MNSASELVFIYNQAQKEILFHSLPLDSFFESVDMTAEPLFVSGFDDKLTTEWQTCLQLKENETHNFSRQVVLAGTTPVHFDFQVIGISLPSTGIKNSLLFLIKKSSSLKTTPESGKDYAEFFDLAEHDMDAPLRKISLLVERIDHTYRTASWSDVDECISRIRANVTEMRYLVESLTKLARVSLLSTEKIICNPEEIVREIAVQWEGRLKENKLVLSVSRLPGLLGDHAQYKQLFSNLLDNSIKFSKETGGNITISSSPATQDEKQEHLLMPGTAYAKITVTDDGIGFNDEYAGKIFEPFVRLNARSRYPGSGLGLAICQRIAGNNNGTIYAKGEEDKGANFTIILPQSPD